MTGECPGNGLLKWLALQLPRKPKFQRKRGRVAWSIITPVIIFQGRQWQREGQGMLQWQQAKRKN